MNRYPKPLPMPIVDDDDQQEDLNLQQSSPIHQQQDVDDHTNPSSTHHTPPIAEVDRDGEMSQQDIDEEERFNENDQLRQPHQYDDEQRRRQREEEVDDDIDHSNDVDYDDQSSYIEFDADDDDSMNQPEEPNRVATSSSSLQPQRRGSMSGIGNPANRRSRFGIQQFASLMRGRQVNSHHRIQHKHCMIIIIINLNYLSSPPLLHPSFFLISHLNSDVSCQL